jgi:hypothetical protein
MNKQFFASNISNVLLSGLSKLTIYHIEVAHAFFDNKSANKNNSSDSNFLRLSFASSKLQITVHVSPSLVKWKSLVVTTLSPFLNPPMIIIYQDKRFVF